MSASILFIQKLNHSAKFPGYFVASTAPHNVEDDPLDYSTSSSVPISASPESYIQEMASYLKEHKGNAEILVVIHGYNTNTDSVREWFDSIQEHIAQHYQSRAKGFVLIGYRWPSEQIIPSELTKTGENKLKILSTQLKNYKNALPFVPGLLFVVGFTGLLISFISWLFGLFSTAAQIPGTVLSLIIAGLATAVALLFFAPILTIILLRFVVYFRDNYRANNFGTPDLVELMRQIDYTLTKDAPEAEKDWGKSRIKLSFIGHSMGAFVVTNAVRILSDVFDARSVGTMSTADTQKKPSPAVGNVFCLSRLVLVSPDIPAETIISGRANFLQSSLRRFEEAYLFSNEGDMALRLASTAANYFCYPSKTRAGGYRLGNVTVRRSRIGPKEEGKEQPEDYGILARLPNGLLVKLQDMLTSQGHVQSAICGGQLAKVEGSAIVNLQGEMLNYSEYGQMIPLYEVLHDFLEPHKLQASKIDCLQQGQIVKLPSGEIASLQNKANSYWHFEAIKENHFCRVQGDKLFAFDDAQFVLLERGHIARIKGENLEIFEKAEGQSMASTYGEPIKISSDQLAVFRHGRFFKYQDQEEIAEEPLAIEGRIFITWRFPLDYNYIREKTPMSARQRSVGLAPGETPIGELFSFFDCTDYVEPNADKKLVGVLSHAKRKKSLSIGDYFSLTQDYFRGRIDTHGGYFDNADLERPSRPEASSSKFVIYGLASVGFEKLLDELSEQNTFTQDQHLTALYAQTLSDLAEHCPNSSAEQRRRIALTQVLSGICQRKQIQVLLSRKCYEENVLGLE
ncbi:MULTISPECIES: alpha/beta hydrolase [Cyanophyceae]|uniref:alpha/beta hydrolase n=1 Tax=Cyanophyceae TaxID=3028117 RepID=UPI0016830B9C|nr:MULTISPECIES: alpha/beta hydrolase [Cyanophyceae]MBD1918027.1 alpha/beta hydrolase [Phormidium sp. FACHB-77]MBD2029275.1 alpha/beta hydrolase [Phormidium sp. FACHB-322]MBD2049807.1 alpha/beta hydrolase [Leptolyngbya sp. FACHB-60]